MSLASRQLCHRLSAALTLLWLGGCIVDPPHTGNTDNFSGIDIKLLVGSALGDFCNQVATQFNQQQPKLDNGTAFRMTCKAEGSGDVVTELVSLAQQLKNGTISANSTEFPTLISVDGEIYQSQLIYRIDQLFPGQNYIPQITDSPLIANSPKAAAEKVIAYLRSPQAQQIATELGLRPGTPGVSLGPKFTAQFGVDPQAKYDSYRPPQPEVVEAMLKSWQEVAKKPSFVVVVVDSSGSMGGNKLPAVQNTLQNYINSLGPKDRIALIDFDTEIRPPVVIDGTPQGRDRGLQFISQLQADGNTKLYDAMASLPSVVMLPLAGLVATGGAMVQKSREPESFNLENPELQRELQFIRSSAKLLADRAKLLREEAAKFLSSSLELELLGTVQYACDRALELPAKIDRLSRRFSGSDLLLSVKDLQQQLTEVQTRIKSSTGVAKQQLQKLAESLQRNIQLAQAGQDARMAQVLSLSNLISDSAGVLQALQNKLRTADLSNSAETMELRSLSNELGSFQENVDILLGK